MLRTPSMEYVGLRKYDDVTLGRVLLHVRKIPKSATGRDYKVGHSSHAVLLLQVDHSIRVGIQHHNLTLFQAN
jgi:hypothetical protein